MLFEFEFDFSSNQSGIKVCEMCSFVESRISCQDGSCLQAIIARWGVSVSNWCFQMGHSYVEKPCNYGVYTLIIFSATFFVATWRYILASLEMLQTLCIAWYLRLAMLAITDYESRWSTSCMAKVYSWKIGSPNCRWKRKINIILPAIYNIILLYLISNITS